MQGRTVIVMALMCFSAAVPALQTIEDLSWPEEGKFPAYPAEQPDGRKVFFSVSGGLERDSNPFRLSDSANPQTALGRPEKSDTVRRLGLGLKTDLPYSRQRVLIEARVEENDYNRFDVLDHTAYRAGVAWKWQAGNQWSGDAGYSRRRFLAGLADLQAPIKDLITEDRVFVSAGYLVTPRWRVRGGLDWSQWDHDEPTRAALDNRTTSATAGLDYVTPAGNSVGGQVKYTEGDYQNRQVVGATPVDNQFEELETSAVARWMVTGKSTLDARLGYTSRRHDQLPQRDFDGVTGRLDYDWFVAAKTLLNFSLWREIRSIEDVQASYVLSTGWGLGPAWAPTAKLVFQAKYLREDRDYRGDPGFILAGGPQREDTFRGVNLSAGYTPRRNVHFSVAVERGDRDSNVAGRDYDFTAVSANARLRF